MFFQVVTPRESFAADAVEESFLVRVDARVVGLHEAILTEGAAGRFLSCVCLHVRLQIFFTTERFPALGADERLLIGRDVHT